jgi:hypothetical protein
MGNALPRRCRGILFLDFSQESFSPETREPTSIAKDMEMNFAAFATGQGSLLGARCNEGTLDKPLGETLPREQSSSRACFGMWSRHDRAALCAALWEGAQSRVLCFRWHRHFLPCPQRKVGEIHHSAHDFPL